MTEEGTVAAERHEFQWRQCQRENSAGSRDRASEMAIGQERQARPDNDRKQANDRSKEAGGPAQLASLDRPLCESAWQPRRFAPCPPSVLRR